LGSTAGLDVVTEGTVRIFPGVEPFSAIIVTLLTHPDLTSKKCNATKLERGRGGVVVKALHYKPAGRGLDSRSCRWNFSVT
jgi:hypothetical protein